MTCNSAQPNASNAIEACEVCPFSDFARRSGFAARCGSVLSINSERYCDPLYATTLWQFGGKGLTASIVLRQQTKSCPEGQLEYLKISVIDYFLRRKAKRPTAPKPAKASVPGSGTGFNVILLYVISYLPDTLAGSI